MYGKITAVAAVVAVAAGALFAGSAIKRDLEIKKFVGAMPLERKIGQMMMVGVPGTKMSPRAQALIERIAPGGIILFGYNLSDRARTAAFIAGLQGAALDARVIPLFVSIDQEGGRVRRIVDGVTQFPGNMPMGVVNDAGLVLRAARILGTELRLMGVNMNLAPALDVNNNPENPVINTRSFGSDPAVVAAMGRAYIQGLQGARCMAVGKHFPGHGDTGSDSHHVLPVIHYGMEHLRKVELPPFATAIEEDVSGIMSVHISYPSILEEGVPATLSPKILTDLLRKEMGHRGLVLTDDMEMNAVSRLMDIGEAAVRSIEAGTDIVLISTSGESIERIQKAVLEAVAGGRLGESRIDESVRRIVEAKLRYSIMELASGNARTAAPAYSVHDLEVLEEGPALNSELSRRALYYHGSGLFAPEEGSFEAAYIVTASPVLRRELVERPVPGLVVLGDTAELASALRNKAAHSRLVYLHVDRPEPEILSRISLLRDMRNTRLFIISTGNPFPVAAISPLPPTLFSFSNTDESLKAVAACLRGEFAPRTDVNVYLGIR